jgi:hypothetical protein
MYCEIEALEGTMYVIWVEEVFEGRKIDSVQ